MWHKRSRPTQRLTRAVGSPGTGAALIMGIAPNSASVVVQKRGIQPSAGGPEQSDTSAQPLMEMFLHNEDLDTEVRAEPRLTHYVPADWLLPV